jgi:hypothetical protein
MPRNLKTEWKRIGRSGATVDGRQIEPEWLQEAAETYNKDEYTALIWPEHERWFNMGTIESVRIEDNDEGGVDLFAEIAPNDYYLQANKAGQKLFTSMELRADFRGTGKHYLTGCAATDSPASAATSEIRFTKSQADAKTLLLAQHIEATTHHFDESDSGENVLRRLLSILSKSSEDDMKKEQFEKLQAQVNAMAEQFTAITTGLNTANEDAGEDTGDQRYAALEKQITELQAKVEKLSETGKDDQEAKTVSLETFNQLQTAFEKLQKDFNEAVNEEQPGTDGGDHISGDDDLQEYI